MPREPRTNWGRVHADGAPQPDPALAQRPPATFVGQCVQRAFPCLDSGDLEHLWVEILYVLHDGTLTGRLDTHPVHNVGYVCGDLVPVRLDQIEAVCAD